MAPFTNYNEGNQGKYFILKSVNVKIIHILLNIGNYFVINGKYVPSIDLATQEKLRYEKRTIYTIFFNT